MKNADVQKLHEAGFITDEQRRKIIEHFHLSEDGGSGKFLAIISSIGAILVTAGIILLISAHWNDIPRGVKIAVGIVLMLGTHGAGWWLREGGKYPKTGEALHFIGSGMFLANIALLGQIYNIVSRPPNAFLLWWIGIAALPWLLRSKAQHVLLLLAVGIWFGFEVNERDSWFSCFDDARQMLLYAVLGLIYLGAGWLLRNTRFLRFAPVTEKFGLLAFLIFFYPLTWKHVFDWQNAEFGRWGLFVMAALALPLLAFGGKNLGLDRQWRWTWFSALVAMIVFMGTVWLGYWHLAESGVWRAWGESWNYVGAIIVLFVFCLLQVQVGLQTRSRFLVNVGVAFIALDVLAAYLDLFGSMQRTGIMFLISGIFLIVFGVYLEKKRRRLMKQLRTSSIPSSSAGS